MNIAPLKVRAGSQCCADQGSECGCVEVSLRRVDEWSAEAGCVLSGGEADRQRGEQQHTASILRCGTRDAGGTTAATVDNARMMAGQRATQRWLSCCRTKQDEDRALRAAAGSSSLPSQACLLPPAFSGVDVFAPLTVVLASSLQPSGITASPRRR